MDNVWILETQEQEFASEDLSRIVGNAIDGHRKSQNYLKKLWPECSWQTIKERVMAEGSIWYVFWMDGVNQHSILYRRYEDERAKQRH